MALFQQEKELVGIHFDREVFEIIKQEGQAEIEKLHLVEEVFFKDEELSNLKEVLPEHYLDFHYDDYGGSIVIEGLSAIVATKEARQIFFKLKHLLAMKGYIVCWDGIIDLNPKKLIRLMILRIFKTYFNLI